MDRIKWGFFLIIAGVFMLAAVLAGRGYKHKTKDDKLYIYSWDTELNDKLEYVYRKYPELRDRVLYVELENNTKYQKKLMDILNDPDSEEYPDLFIVEAGYLKQYTESKYTMPVSELGITEKDLTNMYPYTVEAATNSKDGSVRGLSWQACPGAFFYRRSIAKEYLGTDDPKEVQKYVKDWDSFLDTAKELRGKSNGHIKMLSSANDVAKVFASNKNIPYIDKNGDFQYDNSLIDLFDLEKKMTEEGLTNNREYWSGEWLADMSKNSVFGYFGSTWFLYWSIKPNCGVERAGNGSYGDWAICRGPQNFFWGGSWLCASSNCSDTVLAGKIIKTLTCDTKIMESIAENTSDYVNNKASMQTLLMRGGGRYEMIGSQNYIEVFEPLAESIDNTTMSPYDLIVENLILEQMQGYISGKQDLGTALTNLKECADKELP